MKLSGILILPIVAFFAFFSVSHLAAIETPTPAPTPTEASGGAVGTPIDELRCPKNLSGIGPTWNGITIGVTSKEDLPKYLEQLGPEEPFVTWHPIYEGDFAPNYKFGRPQWGYVYACVVNDKVAALLLDYNAIYTNSYLPISWQHWVSFLGVPTVVSWHYSLDKRIFHWPHYGTSVTINMTHESVNTAQAVWVYFYPFRDENYENLWPVSGVLNSQPFIEEFPGAELNIFDFETAQATLTALPKEYLWPSVTPRATATETPSP